MTTMAAVLVPRLPPSYASSQRVQVLSAEPDDINDLVATAPVADLPAYTTGQRQRLAPQAHAPVAARSPKEFYYELKRRGKAFAILTVIADGAYSKHMPTFVEGTPIKGRVRLILDKPDPIQSVVLTILGQFITGANPGEQLSFIDIQVPLWTQADGEPRQVSSDDGDSSPVRNSGKFSGKLQGDYTWPFSVELPKEVVMPVGPRREPQVFNPPHTFSERHTRATIAYEISARLIRNKLRADHRIPAQFGYVPITRPGAFSPLRRLAYEQGSPLLGPTADPDGWHPSEIVSIKGTAFNTRPVKMTCQVFLAKPLAYTRGSVVPICLRLESQDIQALDLMSSPKSIVARLRRRIKSHYNAEKTIESMAWKDAIDHSQLAVWWPSTEGSPNIDSPVRYVNGELHLRADMKPSSAMSSFRIEYSLILFPFDATGIELVGSDPLIEMPLEIVTAFAPGPRPRMLSPPSYESDVPVHEILNSFSVSTSDSIFL